ncbi:peptidoglycan DD-metalloendopeptidase family protein [Nocardioides okcheonensis]|uniref:peptidoglycan DD-metalloendopeptidase family protein n=1 Tax=Nocardioides okcheonensis TaxID=2894081 RepID=UPI001E4FDD3C|nr:peptidoglycan DD-metalloendopeptidase family protein [Nocardioides okcheonensis]UFN45194.1 peptidoglycan DD-metalloendopeptidase family protein [Nocardioides okcheonensis]
MRGDVVVAQANIPDRVGDAGFTASMPRVLSTRPDFVSLNEMSGRSIAQIEAAAPGYAAFREPDPVPGTSARESLSNVVAWRADTWTRVAGRRVTIVEGDHGFYDGRPILWDRFVTWTMLQRDDGAVVSMLSTHHMINPHKYPRQWGNPPLTRAQQYGQGMDVLTSLAASLAAHGPVLIAGDMNTHASYIDLAWSAVAKMREAGYGWHATAIDFVFYPQHLGVTLAQGWSGTMQSDHPWIAARLAMNGAGPTGAPTATPPTALPTTTGGADGCALGTTVTVGTCTDPSANPSSDPYGLGPVQPHLARLVAILAPLFAIETVGGYRDSARDPGGHPAGLAADFMVPLTTAGERQGTALADYARAHATELGVDYVIWNQRIWSSARADEGWRPMRNRGNPTENHRDHVHINALPTTNPTYPSNPTHAAPTSPPSVCPEVVYPVPQQYIDADQHNWHDAGPSWSSWHTGTDFSMPCGTPVYAAHAGTIEIDTTQPWAGPHLVKVTTGPSALATWYAHLESVTVSRGQTVSAGDQIGTTGDLGNARGCHLHFEVHTQNGPIYGPDNVDPSPWLATHVRTGSTDRASREDTEVYTGLHAGAGARAVGAQEAHHAA